MDNFLASLDIEIKLYLQMVWYTEKHILPILDKSIFYYLESLS